MTSLATGVATFVLNLLGSKAIGKGSFLYCLFYWGCKCPGGSSNPLGDPSLPVSFSSTPNLQVTDLPGGSVQFSTGQFTTETFTPDGMGGYSSVSNNSSSVLLRTNQGTPTDTFTLISGDGTVSTYYGTYPTIATPGRIQTLTDRFGNTETFTWVLMDGNVRLTTVTDSYGRESTFTYDPCQNYLLTQILDFDNRQVTFQYDSSGRLVAVVGPAITRGANNNSNVYPNGTATVFQYDVNNSRPDRQNDLIAVYDPNQVAPYLTEGRTVDVPSVYANATPRRIITYYNDPTNPFQYAKVQQITESTNNSACVGSGVTGFVYINSGLPSNLIDPSDPIVSRTIVTDRNGNQTYYDFNTVGMVVHKQMLANRGKNNLEASSWETWTAYNTHNQPLSVVMPEGNTVNYAYEDESNTITFSGVPYGRRIGLLQSVTRLPGNTLGIPSRPGSGPIGAVQNELTSRQFKDPLFAQSCTNIEERGNEIDTSLYFPPQNGGTTPTDADRSRYATINYFDYQKDTAATVQADTALQAQLRLTSTQIGQLITFVNNQMTATGGTGGIPAGFQMGIGDVNGEGTGNGTSVNARHQGAVVQVQHPSVRQLIPNTGSGDPWVWATQSRVELFTSNTRGQKTTATDPEGNLTVYVRFPENDPEGAGQFLVPTLSNQQYGFMKEIHVDADPNTVMSLVGSDGDMITFIGNKITRTNTPGVYQDLVTKYQPSGSSSGCTSCAYDPLGNPLSMTDPRGFTTTYSRNELGEVYRTTTDAPYSQRVESYYDANRNVTQVDTEDRQVLYETTDATDPNYAKFIPTGSGSVANLPTQPGPGGSVRPGWFTNLYTFDILDNKIEDDIDATGSTPSSLVTTYAHDFNQNLITITKPMGNLVEYDYDERDMRIATRVGYAPTISQPGAVTAMAYDGNGNLLDVISPIQRGTSSQSLSVVIKDAFRSGISMTHVGDWVTANTYDGFDRQIQGTDAVGGTSLNTFDPGGRVIASQANGAAGGSTPTDRTGSLNVPLSSGSANFDEAGRTYELLQNVFLNTGISGSTPTHTLPSTRSVTYTGGGLATNTTANNHTGTVTLTTGGASYVLSRTVFDRASRTINAATDNGALASYSYDGANRQVSMTDPLGNQVQNQFDNNGNVVSSTRLETCTVTGVTTIESFASQMRYDLLNRMVVLAQQGPDGNLDPTLNVCCVPPETPNLTLFTLYGFDSRGNRTNLIDPKQNTTAWTYDGASRQLQNLRNLRTNGDGTQGVFETVVTANSYDGNSRLIRLIDDNGGTTTWNYDTLDRQTKMTFHDGSTRNNTFDLASDLIGYVDENASVFANTFDVLGRKTTVSITRATAVIGTTAQSFQYDGQSRMTLANDNVASVFAGSGFYFDSLSRVVEEVESYGS